MGFFAPRRSGASEPSTHGFAGVGSQPAPVLFPIPSQFEAVAEALAADAEVLTACAVLGHELARDGIDLGAALQGLEETYRAVRGVEPGFAATEAMALAWSEETLAYLHQISCEDELTGLASQAHLRSRLSEIYREADQGGPSPRSTHALVVVDLAMLANPSDPFSRALWLVRAAADVRTVFPGGDTICKMGATRLVVLTQRGAGLGARVATVGEHVSAGADVSDAVRVWIEGLPGTVDSAAVLLDELSRRWRW